MRTRMLRGSLFAVVLCVLLAACTGCKAPNLQDRMNDAGQVARLNVGLGPGFLVNAQVTRALELGVGAYDARRCGFRNGYGWIWDERRYDTNLVIPIWGWEDVDAVLYGGMPVTPVRGDDRHPLPPGTERCCWRWSGMPLTINDKNRGWLEVAANVHLIYFGIDAGVDVGQFIDWAAGWFGLDPAGDDQWTGVEVEKHGPSPTPTPLAAPTQPLK